MFTALVVAADRSDRAQRHRDDRRDQPARPGAAGRRHQGEGAGGAPRRASARCCCRRATGRTSRTSRRARAQALEFVWLETVDDAIRAALGDEGCADQDARQPSRRPPRPSSHEVAGASRRPDRANYQSLDTPTLIAGDFRYAMRAESAGRDLVQVERAYYATLSSATVSGTRRSPARHTAQNA